MFLTPHLLKNARNYEKTYRFDNSLVIHIKRLHFYKQICCFREKHSEINAQIVQGF